MKMMRLSEMNKHLSERGMIRQMNEMGKEMPHKKIRKGKGGKTTESDTFRKSQRSGG